MSKKGISLIEMLMAIMILAIAGFMIVSGFMAVLRNVSKANDIQDTSNIMLSYAEKSDVTSIKDEISSQRNDITYTISNDRGKQVDVQSQINSLSSSKNDNITLHLFQKEMLEDVKQQPTYIKSIEHAEKLYKLSNDITSQIPSGLPYATAFTTIFNDFYFGSWDAFASELLPKALGSLALPTKPYKIVGYYPWEHFKGTAYENGQVLIYLSQNYTQAFPVVQKEVVHVVYDYLEQRWYYNPGDDYEIAYEGYSEIEPVFLYKGENQQITSFQMLQSFMKASNGGWYALDKNSEYDPQFPDNAWLPVK